MDNEQIAELKRLAETANQLHSTVQQEEEFWDKATPFAVMELIEIIERATEAKPSASAAPGIDDLRRYARVGATMAPAREGQYVKFEDAAAAIAAAREEGALEREAHLMQSHAPLMDAASAKARIAKAEQEAADLRARLAAPEGYVFVPVEPTPKMLEDGSLSLSELVVHSGQPKSFEELRGDLHTAYAAMLSAAPQAKAPQQPPAGEDAGLLAAVGKLIKAKGRYHTEQNYAALVAAYDGALSRSPK